MSDLAKKQANSWSIPKDISVGFQSLFIRNVVSQASRILWFLIFLITSVVLLLSHFSHVQLFATLWTVIHQAPLSIGFSRQEYWSGLPCPSPGDLPVPWGQTHVSYISICQWCLKKVETGASLVIQMVMNPLAVQVVWVRSLGLGGSPGEGNGYSLQYSCLENPMDRGAWRVTVHGVKKSWTQLSN